MNWGKGIFIFMTCFIVFIMILVIKLISTNVDLESDDYYTREINYSEEMNAVDNANKLEEKINISITETHLVIQVPHEKKMKNIEFKLIRIDNDKLDRTFAITDTKTFLIDKKELVKGIYRIELYYTMEGVKYMQKEQIYL